MALSITRNIKLYFTTLFFAGFIVACGKGSGGSASPTSYVTIKFTSSTLQPTYFNFFSTFAPERVTSCTSLNVTGVGAVAGECFTPYKVSGSFRQAQLGSTGGGAPVRILGGGNLYHGFQDVMRHESFDLSTAISMTGDDNIEDGTGGPYNLLTLDAQFLEYTFRAHIGADPKYVTVRNYFAPSIPSTSTLLTDCGLTSGELAEADLYGTLHAGIAAQSGDIMVCVKNASTDTCAAEDFNWVDASGELHPSTGDRPASPKQITGTYLTNTPSCTQSSGHPEITWGETEFASNLSDSVSISAVNGSRKVYTSGSASGDLLEINIDISATDSLFVPTSSGLDLGSVGTQAQLMQSIDKVLLTPIYNNAYRSNNSSANGAILASTVSFTITDDGKSSSGGTSGSGSGHN